VNLFQNLSDLTQLSSLNAALWGFLATFALCIFTVVTKGWHGKFTMDTAIGIQKAHTDPTPRIGGIPIVLGLFVVLSQASADIRDLLTPVLLAGLPAFMFGTAEDLTNKVGVLPRLMATMLSGVLAWWITGYSLTRVDLWGFDTALQWLPFSVLFTAFAVGGVANAINIIDGFNGLASTSVTLAFLGFALISVGVGDTSLTSLALVLAAVVWGFFWVNWPLGKLFLGDGGSYFLGFALAWVAVLMVQLHPEISPFAPLLVCVHPVTEVLFSIYRRRMRREHPGMPDRLHFHSLFQRRYVARWFSSWSGTAQNSITGLLVGFMTLTAVLLAQLVYTSALLSLFALFGLSLGYVSLYARMVRHRWCSPFNFLFVQPASTSLGRLQ
jgi:UDP-N-acetylmuramyl pentapeptide phosphotransferase/UDP-N-acetylglucosamine-1-phosphate transferase